MAVNKKKKQAAQEDDFFEYDDAFTINEEDISGARRRSDRKRGNDTGRGAERGSEAKKDGASAHGASDKGTRGEDRTKAR